MDLIGYQLLLEAVDLNGSRLLPEASDLNGSQLLPEALDLRVDQLLLEAFSPLLLIPALGPAVADLVVEPRYGCLWS